MVEEDKSEQDYINKHVNPIMEEIVSYMISSKPADPANFMLDFLLKKTGDQSMKNEREELLQLRRELAMLKNNMPYVQEAEKSQSESEEEEEENLILELPVPIQKKKGPRTSVSAEAFGQYNQKQNYEARVIPKNQEQKDRIADKLSRAFMFQALDDKDRAIVIDAMEEKKFKAGQQIINQGDDGLEMYVVDSGRLECFKQFPGEIHPKKVREYSAGEAFGELALLYNAPRAASITCLEDSVLWILDRGTFTNIVKESSMQRYENFMNHSPLFKETDVYERQKIADAFKQVSFQSGDYVVREGDWGDIFYIIEEGTAIATKTLEPGKPPEKVKDYEVGEYFGELALLRGEPRAASIIATSSLKCATLDRYSFKRLLGPLEDILKRNSTTYAKFVQK